MANLGERLRELRREKGLTLKKLGEIVKVSENTVSQWENNKREPNIQMIVSLANFFDVTTGQLIGTEPLP